MSKNIKFTKETYLDTTSITNDLIYIGFERGSKWTEKDVWVPVGFGVTLSQCGNKLTRSSKYVKVGAGVKRVRVTGLLTYYQCPSNDYMFMAITINNKNKVKTIAQTNQWGFITLNATLTVQENDLIGLAVYKSNESKYTLEDFSSFTDTPANYLLVEVVQ